VSEFILETTHERMHSNSGAICGKALHTAMSVHKKNAAYL